MKCRIRIVSPIVRDWVDCEGDSLEDAVNTLHTERYDYDSLTLTVEPSENPEGDGWYSVHYARFEIEGEGERISRFFRKSIRRKGGVGRSKPLADRLADIARKLGWTKPAAELLASGWDGESDGWT